MLPFQIVVRRFFQNSRLQMLSKAGAGAESGREPGNRRASCRAGSSAGDRPDERDTVSALIEIVPKGSAAGMVNNSLGTWLVSEALGAPQSFPVGVGPGKSRCGRPDTTSPIALRCKSSLMNAIPAPKSQRTLRAR